jgi:transposase
MVWGFISSFGDSGLEIVEGKMTAEDYIDILSRNINYNPHMIIFQDDNDPKHRSRMTLEWKNLNRLESLNWPSNSPDMNPIEHVWAEIDKAIHRRENPYNLDTKENLWLAIQTEFYNLSNEYISSLYESMPQRVHKLLRCKGFHTKY